jgi:hypothetical protein
LPTVTGLGISRPISNYFGNKPTAALGFEYSENSSSFFFSQSLSVIPCCHKLAFYALFGLVCISVLLRKQKVRPILAVFIFQSAMRMVIYIKKIPYANFADFPNNISQINSSALSRYMLIPLDHKSSEKWWPQ